MPRTGDTLRGRLFTYTEESLSPIMRPLHVVLILYGIVNAAAYSCLLPLWEGFDEAYHYGYVQVLATSLRFPVLGQATLSREIWHTFEFAPVSHYLQPYTRAPVNFTDCFALPA